VSKEICRLRQNHSIATVEPDGVRCPTRCVQLPQECVESEVHHVVK